MERLEIEKGAARRPAMLAQDGDAHRIASSRFCSDLGEGRSFVLNKLQTILFVAL
jgi:hypothetical protein